MMEAEYLELIDSFLALQHDYEHIGFRNDAVYARSCRALDWAEKNRDKVLALIRAGENGDDWAKHLGKED